MITGPCRSGHAWLLLTCVLSLPALGLAQGSRVAPPADVQPLDSLFEATRQRVARYADRRIAIGEGYRRLGPDFPGMGEHWLHPVTLLTGDIDAGRPTMLVYATLGGRPTLLGAGFVITTRGSGVPNVPGWPSAWHEHSGLLSEEAGLGAGRSLAAAEATRVWVLHAWTELANPAGRFVPDNWALPFVRAGLPAPTAPDADAARALSLIVGGDRYLREMLTVAQGSRAASQTLDEAILDARTAAEAVAASARRAGYLTSEELERLRAVWRSLALALRAALGPAVEPFLSTPHNGHVSSGSGSH